MKILLILPISFLLNIFIKKPKFDPFIFTKKLYFLFRNKIQKYYKNNILDFIIGTLFSIIIMAISFLIPFFILMQLYKLYFIVGLLFELFLCYIVIGIRKPIEVSYEIYNNLKNEEVAKEILKENTKIDIDNTDEIIKNTIEYTSISIAQDYIYTSIFLLLGGAPLCILYKTIDTLSSSSSNSIYLDEDKTENIFDIFNIKLCYIIDIIPSIFTSLIYVLTSILFKYEYKNALLILKRDGKKNKDRLKASIAGALNIELGGEYMKDGDIYHREIIGDYIEDLEPYHIKKANKLILTSAIFSLAILIIIKLIIMLFSIIF